MNVILFPILLALILFHSATSFINSELGFYQYKPHGMKKEYEVPKEANYVFINLTIYASELPKGVSYVTADLQITLKDTKKGTIVYGPVLKKDVKISTEKNTIVIKIPKEDIKKLPDGVYKVEVNVIPKNKNIVFKPDIDEVYIIVKAGKIFIARLEVEMSVVKSSQLKMRQFPLPFIVNLNDLFFWSFVAVAILLMV